MGVVVVDGGVLASGDALHSDVGDYAIAVGGARKVSLGKIGGVAYFEFHIQCFSAFQLFVP